MLQRKVTLLGKEMEHIGQEDVEIDIETLDQEWFLLPEYRFSYVSQGFIKTSDAFTILNGDFLILEGKTIINFEPQGYLLIKPKKNEIVIQIFEDRFSSLHEWHRHNDSIYNPNAPCKIYAKSGTTVTLYAKKIGNEDIEEFFPHHPLNEKVEFIEFIL